ncbi:hypothetical protein K505DRAFT_54879 [Melanomma pulvis-pyrius CBS 109.77]|uniref:Uncharacterized protein n=1 Tax=Melanomma pulvis-pyrius CBS 109.77 TaxID=1314802 RepID=A0A6A6X7Q6_9PLEO|nr:hypothetical protein K505DRAFT_54879 [Melanomma pulvis-pyrius CBS 109.77]
MAIREKAMVVVERLSWISESLEELITSDAALGVLTFDRRAFSEIATRHLSTPDLRADVQYILRVRRIL